MAGKGTNPIGDRLDLLGRGVDTGKNLFALLRDLIIFLLVVMLIATPACMREQLHEAGFVSGKVWEFEWRAEIQKSNLAVDTRVQGATSHTKAAQDALQALLTASPQLQADPDLRRRVVEVWNNLVQVRRRLDDASSDLATTVVQQERALERVAPRPSTLQGWVSTNGNLAELPDGAVRGAPVIVGRQRNLRVRAAPGTDSQVRGILPAGSRAEIVSVGRGPWMEVVQR